VDIKQDEIKEIKKIGTLNGSEVKLVTLKGGFHIGMGKKGKKSKKSEILAVGSHPALVSHQISKKHGSFEQVMAKNERDAMPSVTDYSHNLSSSEKSVRGLDIVAMKKNEKVEFQITKHNFEIFSISASELNGEIVLEKSTKNEEMLSSLNKQELSKKLTKTIKEYAQENGLKIKKNF
jgi:late competence protein required for DNA uptake (superfamily II DNA/RNA helicase)